MRSLSRLLHPYNLDEFLQHNWAKKAIVISRKDQQHFDHLFSWGKLNNLLNFQHLNYPDLRLALNGQVLDESENANLLYWCQQGATLIINQVHRWIPELATLTSELKYDLGYNTQINAYCSWAKPGFSCHYDTHDAFILQIEGSKQWFVFADTLKYPLLDQKSSSFTPPETDPYLSCVLHPGDVLYIPRGHWHYAVAIDQPSLHLTLGIHCKTGIDFLEWLVNELRQQEDWRRSLPLRAEAEPVCNHISTLLQTLSQYVVEHNLCEQYTHYLDSLGKPKYAFPYQTGINIFLHGTATRFTTPPFQRLKLSTLPDCSGYQITVAGKEVSLRGVTQAFIQTLFNTGAFTGQDVMNWLPDYDWEVDIIPLLSRLVMEGIIFVDTTG
ncbi:MAG: cupin [Cyanobacteria bacterium CRU_2_1]|nr:cupin [Cyanobacteria bacterium CRU_2_1]